MGDERSTWTSGGQYWPEMLIHDLTFNGQNIYVYRYPSPLLNRTFSIDEIADNMRLVLTTDGVLSNNELTFVSHSMGGVITRAFILKYRNVVPKIRLLYFFATPTTGSPYAVFVGTISRNPQFKQLYPMPEQTRALPEVPPVCAAISWASTSIQVLDKLLDHRFVQGGDHLASTTCPMDKMLGCSNVPPRRDLCIARLA
jgi:pimeloyl-ACP methyl ester carboxylesterase